MRLFVAVGLPAHALEAVGALHRPEVPGVRWTSPDQWHVTLRFLAELSDQQARVAMAGLDRLAGAGLATTALMGPRTRVLGSHVLCVPVDGLAELARAVADLTATVGPPPERRPFFGHLTLARGRRGVRLGPLAGAPVAATWPVDEVNLVRSRLGAGEGGGARYEIVQAVPLAV